MHPSSTQSRIFYGWWIVAATFVLALLMGGFIVLGFTAFFEPIAREFGWSYAQISLAASLLGVEAGLLAPLVGLLVDRWGPRRIVFIASIVSGFGLLMLSRTTSLAMYYGAFAVLALGYSGFSPTVMMTAVANWFRRKISTAIGIMASGFALGGLLIPLIVRLIDTYSWRTALFVLCLALWVMGMPLSLLLRHKPEQYGYSQDGEDSHDPVSPAIPASKQTRETHIGVRSALANRTFWHLGLGMACQYLAVNGVIVHVMPYLSSVGVSRSTATIVATALPLVSIVGRLSSGWVGDRFEKKRVAAGSFALLGLGLLFFSYASADSLWLMAPFIVFFGIGWGSNVTMRAALVRDYFGRERFGSILGFIMGLIAVGSILGPFLAGAAFDRSGSYRDAWLAFTGLSVVGLIILATTPRIKNP